MRALVVYESACGRAREVARAIADNLMTVGAAVETMEAAAAPEAFDHPVDLLVVGAPGPSAAAHPAGLPEQPSRDGTARRAPDPAGPAADGTGVGAWIERIRLPHGQPTATFDVRADRRVRGSAARAAAHRLRERGATIIGTQSFQVLSPDGVLPAGEQGHARAWAAGLVVDAAIHRVG